MAAINPPPLLEHIKSGARGPTAWLKREYDVISGYCDAFDLSKPALPLTEDCLRITARFLEIEARRLDPVEIAKRDRVNAARAERIAKHQQEERERRAIESAAWRERTLASWLTWETGDETPANCPVSPGDFATWRWDGVLSLDMCNAIYDRLAAAQQEHYRLESLERERQRALNERERAEAWLRGERIYGGLGRRADGSCYLRVNGDLLETSQGANIPLSHAVRLWPLLRRCNALGVEWEPNGRKPTLGSFQLDRVDAVGNFKAGCHFVSIAESMRIAELLGITAAELPEIRARWPLGAHEDSETAAAGYVNAAIPAPETMGAAA
jgi:hypothetical protein